MDPKYFGSIDAFRKHAAAVANMEKMLISISAVTNLSVEEILEVTGGKHLDIVLKAAALTGRCMEYQLAAKHIVANSLDDKSIAKLAYPKLLDIT